MGHRTAETYKLASAKYSTDPLVLARLAKTVDTLCAMGRPLNVALYDVQVSHGLCRADLVELIRLIEIKR